MTKQIRIRGVRRKPIDEDKLALAFLLLAKAMADEQPELDKDETSSNGEQEAA